MYVYMQIYIKLFYFQMNPVGTVNKCPPCLKNLHWLSERMMSLSIMGAHSWAPFKLLSTIECCDVRAVLGAHNCSPMMLRNVSLSAAVFRNVRN